MRFVDLNRHTNLGAGWSGGRRIVLISGAGDNDLGDEEAASSRSTAEGPDSAESDVSIVVILGVRSGRVEIKEPQASPLRIATESITGQRDNEENRNPDDSGSGPAFVEISR